MSQPPPNSSQSALFESEREQDSEGQHAFGRIELPASQIEPVPLVMPGATPPSTMTEPLFGSSLAVGSTMMQTMPSSQQDLLLSHHRTRPRSELGELHHLLSPPHNNDPSSVAGTLPAGNQRTGIATRDLDQLSIPTSSNPPFYSPHPFQRTDEPHSSSSYHHPHHHQQRQGQEAPLPPPPNARPSTSANERIRVIWGTNIVISDAISAFRSFLTTFTPAHRKMAEARAQPDGPLPAMLAQDMEPLYPRLLQQICDTEIYNLNLDCANLRAFPPTTLLAHQLLHYPTEIISLMDMVINELFAELYPDADLSTDPIQVRPFNTGSTINMRELDPSDIDKLITIKGLIIRVSNIIPDMRVAYFVCGNCAHACTVENIRGRIAEPTRCPRPGCDATHSMVLVHNRCLFSDKQIIKIQETPDAIPDGQTPHSVTLCVYDALVDVARPGDRVQVTGIFRSAPVRVNQRQRKIRALFRTFIDVVHLKRTDADRLKLDPVLASSEDLIVGFDETDMVRADEAIEMEELRTLASTPRLYDRLSHAIAPSVWGLENVKKGLLLQLFGGVSKVFRKAGSARFRGDINVLLAGDPGVSKSQLLQYVHKLAPRGIYTSGKGSSAVGLTAYITRDAESNQLVLESGALVLSDGGICCIDEFDKMSEETRTILHEVMEQQTVSIAKAGIITTLNARASILASANPIDSKYNPSRSIVENLNLPPTILSRFDIIYLILDNVNMEDDQRLGRHIVHLYTSAFNFNSSPQGPSDNIDSRLLAKYISHARTLNPVLSEEAVRDLANGYVSMRKVNGTAGKTISATTRQLESLIRLSEAHARMRLSMTVESRDVTEAVRLVREALLSYAVDPLTGKIDMDLITTGKSSALRERQAELKRQVKAALLNKGITSIEFATLLAEMNAQSSIPVNERWLRDVVEELAEEEFIYLTGNIRRGMATLHRVAQ